MHDRRFFTDFLLKLAVLLLVGLMGVLAGCTSLPGTSGNPPDVLTESDEPPHRKRASTRLQLAVLYFGEGKFNVALDEVKQAILVDPEWFESYNMRGLIYMRMNNFALADASFQKALSINPNSAEVKHNYAVTLCKENRYADAMRMFSSALATPGYAQKANTWMEQGACQLSMGHKVDAEDSYSRSFAIDPNNRIVALGLATLLFQRGEAAKAQFFIRGMNSGSGASAESLWLGVKVERRLGNAEAASRLGSQLQSKYPQSVQALAWERSAFDE